jgi:predicted metal-dependent phosphoesterase TrpH
MRQRLGPLLAELHAHTTWSDGELSVSEIVDLYGSTGFDVLCITDHVIRTDDPWLDASEWRGLAVRPSTHHRYRLEIDREAMRARRQYDLLVLPGLELTYNDLDPNRAAHAVAVGLGEFVGVDHGIGEAIDRARACGAALIAAHPFDDESSGNPARLTRGFAADARLRARVHRFELFNRTTLFGWVGRAGLPTVATGDFHRLEHLEGWKTLLPCEKDAGSVIAYLRSPRPTYLTQIGGQRLPAAAPTPRKALETGPFAVLERGAGRPTDGPSRSEWCRYVQPFVQASIHRLAEPVPASFSLRVSTAPVAPW